MADVGSTPVGPTSILPDVVAARSRPDPRSVYSARADAFVSKAAVAQASASRIGNVRLLVFLLAVGLFFAGDVVDFQAGRALRVSALALGIPFLALVVAHGRARGRRARFEAMRRANAEGVARIERRWDDLSSPTDVGGLVDPLEHPYAGDLDVIGHASLLRLLSGVATSSGWHTLSRWLLEPGREPASAERQKAVEELSGQLDLRDEVAVSVSRATTGSTVRLRSFIDWAESAPLLSDRKALIWGARIVPAVTLLLLGADLTGVLQMPLWLVSGAVGIGLALRHTKALHEVFERAGMGEGDVRSFGVLLDVLAVGELASPELRRLQDACREDGGASAARALQRLRLLLDLTEVRRSGLFHLPLHWVGLWDFHVLVALERWQHLHGARVRGWLAAVGALDALCALGALRFEHPDWTFPAITDGGGGIKAEALGHPLLVPSATATNDVEIGPPGTFLFVTGSNMSGKSTLLRSIGLNSVLAMAGAPVFARRMELPRVQVWTSMRVADDLERSVSQFLAEVDRVRRIVDAARARGPADPPILFLLDEMLRGTNTAERQAGGRRVLKHLLQSDSFGAVTSHDLALADTEALRSQANAVHFSESVSAEAGGPGLVFDYRLRSGVATSTNALRILELMGLGEVPDSPPPLPDDRD